MQANIQSAAFDCINQVFIHGPTDGHTEQGKYVII
jgi:hypothetical protein